MAEKTDWDNKFPVGTRVGEWTIMGNHTMRQFTGRIYATFPCRCSCGVDREVMGKSLIDGTSTSCGCMRIKAVKVSARRHGGSYSRIYTIWQAMKLRCNKPAHREYKNYGGRGISVCPEWMNDFAPFQEWALGNNYDDGLEIDRIDNDGNYEPGNCRWVTHVANCNNKRNTKLVEAFGETKSESEWIRDPRCLVSQGALRYRLSWGWSPEQAIGGPPHKLARRKNTSV